MGRGMFITCLYGELHLREHRFRYASAGHCPPWIFGGGAPETLRAGGKPLGLFPPALFDASLVEHEVPLEPGRTLLLYTDGLVEAMDPEGRQLGEAAVAGILAARKDGAAAVEALRSAVHRHRGGREATDDLTLLAVGRTAIRQAVPS